MRARLSSAPLRASLPRASPSHPCDLPRSQIGVFIQDEDIFTFIVPRNIVSRTLSCGQRPGGGGGGGLQGGGRAQCGRRAPRA
jgi:hypothetical protein